MTESPRYECGEHGEYTPDFDREVDGQVCPRIVCKECEKSSFNADLKTRPKNVTYSYDGESKVVLQEAHFGSAVWKFDPPVIHPEWHFAEDLSPVVAEGALTEEEIMARMEKLLPEVERMAREMKLPDPRDLLILPGEALRVEHESS